MQPLKDSFSQRRMILAVFMTALISTIYMWHKYIPKEYKENDERETPNRLEISTNTLPGYTNQSSTHKDLITY